MTDKQLILVLRQCEHFKLSGHCEKCEYEMFASCDRRLCAEASLRIEKLLAENAVLREKQRWIPVTERLPKKQAWYHVAIRDEKTMRIYVEQDLYAVETAKNFGHKIGFCKDGRWEGRERIIAWMSFPEAPKEEEA